MAYFSNATQGEIYRAKYCNWCINNGDDEDSCPIWDLHLMWNYDAVGKNADETKRIALNALIPVEGIENLECKFFVLFLDE